MTAIVVARIRVTDPVKYSEYQGIAMEAITAHGGRYLVRGAGPTVLEGEEDHERYVVVEFDSVESATAFYDSAEYRRARAAREGAAETVICALQGV